VGFSLLVCLDIRPGFPYDDQGCEYWTGASCDSIARSLVPPPSLSSPSQVVGHDALICDYAGSGLHH